MTTPSLTLPQLDERQLGEGVAKRGKKFGRKGKLYIPAERGDGVAFEHEKIKPDIMRRIEALGVMNDRRVAYVAARDGESLLRLAKEYDAKKMPVMAETVRKEAYEFGISKSETRGRRRGKRGTARDDGAVDGEAVGDVFAGAGGAAAGGDAGDV